MPVALTCAIRPDAIHVPSASTAVEVNRPAVSSFCYAIVQLFCHCPWNAFPGHVLPLAVAVVMIEEQQPLVTGATKHNPNARSDAAYDWPRHGNRRHAISWKLRNPLKSQVCRIFGAPPILKLLIKIDGPQATNTSLLPTPHRPRPSLDAVDCFQRTASASADHRVSLCPSFAFGPPHSALPASISPAIVSPDFR